MGIEIAPHILHLTVKVLFVPYFDVFQHSGQDDIFIQVGVFTKILRE